MALRDHGEGGLEYVMLRTPQGESAEIYLFGAHVTSWQTKDGDDVLFVSREAIFKPPKAIRGGVPVCFPQFDNMGPIGRHGFARNSLFKVESSSEDSVTLLLKPTESQLKEYPHPFELRLLKPTESQLKEYPHPFELRVTVSLSPDSLGQSLEVKNTGEKEMAFTCALHTYYVIADISKAQVTGLTCAHYLDSTKNREKIENPEDSVSFEGEVDRVYCGVGDKIMIVDGAKDRTVILEKSGFPDAIVWNPWIEKSKNTSDFGDEEYKEMLCVEPAVAGSGPITLPPGETWIAQQVLSIQKKK